MTSPVTVLPAQTETVEEPLEEEEAAKEDKEESDDEAAVEEEEEEKKPKTKKVGRRAPAGPGAGVSWALGVCTSPLLLGVMSVKTVLACAGSSAGRTWLGGTRC